MGEMRKSRKGIFFTLTAILITAFFLLTIRNNQVPVDDVQQIRIQLVHDFLAATEQSYAKEYLEISAVKALRAYDQVILSREGTGQDPYPTHVEGEFSTFLVEMMRDGYAPGSSTLHPIMDGNTLDARFNELRMIGEDLLSISLDLSMSDITISQASPWIITVTGKLSYHAESPGLGLWQKESIIASNISIEGFDDPLYSAHGLAHPIKKSVVVDWSQDTRAAVTQHYLDTTYRSYPAAPSFLGRYYGSTSPSPFGIESIIRPAKFGLSQDFVSYADYIYFTCGIGDPSCRGCDKVYMVYPNRIPFVTEPVYLDEEHILSYSIYESEPACPV